jgi:acyl-CoA reductase-like NAD-dependent aldehyde dehydrogenase
MFVGGKWMDADSAKTFDVVDPGTGHRIAKVTEGGKSDIGRAVDAAQDAFRMGTWAKMPVKERAQIIRRLADLVDKNRLILAQLDSLDVGKPLWQAYNADVPSVSKTLRYYADLSVTIRTREPIVASGYESHTFREPYGVCAFIFPWNYPVALIGQGIAPAIAAGNTVVVKPAEDTPLSSLYFCNLVQEAGIPDGVINVVPGLGHVAGAALSQHQGIKRMSFTGSPEVGKLIGEACGRNLVPVKLELGGKGAAVVFDDVDLSSTVTGLSNVLTENSGQLCCTATRWLIQESVLDRFVEKAVAQLQSVRIGYGLDPETQMGPLVSEKQRQRVLGYLKRGVDEGASELLKGGAASVAGHEGGYYVKPALLTGSPDNICAREEIFGPVAFVIPFSDEAEAIELVNRSDYGLGNSVWTKDLERANRVAESLVAGTNWINAHANSPLEAPGGACNLSGLGGGGFGPEALYDYLRPAAIVRPVP